MENRDFVVFTKKGENLKGGRPSAEYHLTIDAGKHVSMMSGTDKGFEVRDYFIECERVAKDLIALLNNSATMTSREIADLVEKRHDSVKRSIERLAESGIIRNPPLVETEEINNLGLPRKIKQYVFALTIFTGRQGENLSTNRAIG